MLEGLIYLVINIVVVGLVIWLFGVFARCYVEADVGWRIASGMTGLAAISCRTATISPI
ncbi:hypothetical protein M2189_002421 [Bradyrhizobium japonicum]|nr:hypothetical protein [Bradyrhizobium japonicum]MCS3959218.1 hypothetical protein [Bradyrhizobium japonicum]MCS4000973.1 hypothetical protein [Bradyrhizobium japonicum]